MKYDIIFHFAYLPNLKIKTNYVLNEIFIENIPINCMIDKII